MEVVFRTLQEGGKMSRERKISDPVTLFAAIEAEQHEALRMIAFKERRSIADVVREAIAVFVEKHPGGVTSSVAVLDEERIGSRSR